MDLGRTNFYENYKLDSLQYHIYYLVERRGQYDDRVGMILPLKKSYMNYKFLAIETYNINTREFHETVIHTYDFYQDYNENYKYRIAGFLIKPNSLYTELEILDLPKDGFTHLNSILGIY